MRSKLTVVLLHLHRRLLDILPILHSILGFCQKRPLLDGKTHVSKQLTLFLTSHPVLIFLDFFSALSIWMFIFVVCVCVMPKKMFHRNAIFKGPLRLISSFLALSVLRSFAHFQHFQPQLL